MKELENKVALVSSSTRGIGLACAKALAAQGAAVYLGVRRLEAGQQIADELIAAGGRPGWSSLTPPGRRAFPAWWTRWRPRRAGWTFW